MFTLDHGTGKDVISYNRNIYIYTFFFFQKITKKKEKTFVLTFKKAIAVGY